MDTYRALAAPADAELPRLFGSRFLAYAWPVADADEADAHVAALRRKLFDATHHCFAYRWGTERVQARSSDAGEPSGTAGLPILRQIEGRDLTNTLVVVVRYYGGTKLGTGGLIRAYGDAAAAVLDAAVIEEHVVRVPVVVRFAYADTSPALHVLRRLDAEIGETRYGEATEVVALVRPSQVDDLQALFTDALGGRGEVVETG